MLPMAKSSPWAFRLLPCTLEPGSRSDVKKFHYDSIADGFVGDMYCIHSDSKGMLELPKAGGSVHGAISLDVVLSRLSTYSLSKLQTNQRSPSRLR